MDRVLELLKENIDLKYKDFSSSLSPTLDKELILGIRVPIIKKITNSLTSDEKEKYLIMLPHKYYEEILLHRFIIEKIKDYDKALFEINKLLPYLNSWSLTDGFSNKAFEKNKDKLLIEIKKWIKNPNNYIKRFAIGLLMKYYLDNDFNPSYLDLVCNTKTNNDYYLEMMIAWFLATALAKQYDVTSKYIINAPINDFIFKKTISKCMDSYRIPECNKKYLKSLRVINNKTNN